MRKLAKAALCAGVVAGAGGLWSSQQTPEIHKQPAFSHELTKGQSVFIPITQSETNNIGPYYHLSWQAMGMGKEIDLRLMVLDNNGVPSDVYSMRDGTIVVSDTPLNNGELTGYAIQTPPSELDITQENTVLELLGLGPVSYVEGASYQDRWLQITDQDHDGVPEVTGTILSK